MTLSPLERLGLEVVAYTMLGTRSGSSILVALLEANGRTCSYEALWNARRWKARTEKYQSRHSIQVRICLLRSALEDLGFPGVVQTEVDLGYAIRKADRQRLLDWLIEEAAA